jgi:hypothetical protein
MEIRRLSGASSFASVIGDAKNNGKASNIRRLCGFMCFALFPDGRELDIRQTTPQFG